MMGVVLNARAAEASLKMCPQKVFGLRQQQFLCSA